MSRNERGRFGALKSDSTQQFFRNACTKSGSLRFSQFPGCWLFLSVYILMSFDFPFVDCSEFGNFVITLIVNTMTVHMYVMYCYIIYMCLLFTLIKVIIHWPFIPPLIISAIRGSIKSVTCTKPGIWISTLIFRTPIILLILNRLSFVFVGRLFSWLLFINNFYVQTSSILCFTFATNKFVPWREIWLPSETTNLLTALPLADKPVFSQTVTIVLSMYLYCNNTTHFNIFSLSSISLTVRNGRESTILANVP